MKLFTQFFDAPLDAGQLPADGSTSAITPAPKDGNKDNWESYRPTSLTSIVLRTAERALCHRKVNRPQVNKAMMGNDMACLSYELYKFPGRSSR